jgi:hypothetical protein
MRAFSSVREMSPRGGRRRIRANVSNDILDATIQPRNGAINRPAITFGPVAPSGGGKGETVLN